MIYSAKIEAKNFPEDVTLDKDTVVKAIGKSLVKVNETIFLDVKGVTFEDERIMLDCIYAEDMTIYGRCAISFKEYEEIK